MQKGSKEFVIHVDHEPDYRVTCEQYVPHLFNLFRMLSLAIEFYRIEKILINHHFWLLKTTLKIYVLTPSVHFHH